jgi:uncharacterized repeat protein (TIGR01451 family)
MKFPTLLLIAVCSVLCSVAALCSQVEPVQSGETPRVPLFFEPNAGQTAAPVRYIARSLEGSLFFTPEGVTVAVPQAGSFELRFIGSQPRPQITGEELLASRSNYLASTGHSITGVANYGSLRFRNAYRGIDLRFYGYAQHLEHDVLIAPGADPAQFVLQLEGVDNLRLSADGNVEFQLGSAAMHESAPVAWQIRRGRKVFVAARWELEAGSRLHIKVGAYDKTQPLTIDPVLSYSTHLGGNSGNDETTGSTFPAVTAIYSVVVDPARNIYVAGTTSATDFPTTAGAYNRSVNYLASFHADTTSQSGFVTKFDKSGMLVYSTFLHSWINNIAVDSSGEVYTAKYGSDSFSGPGIGYDNGIDVDKLSSDGSRLLYSYAYGKTPVNPPPQCSNVPGDSGISGISVDNSGHAWIAGSTSNPCLIVSSNAYEKTLKGSESGFVAKLDASKSGDASVVYSTYLGGSQVDYVSALAVDASGVAYVTGQAGSSDFPHSVTFGSDSSGTAFISKLNADGSALLFSSLLTGVSYNNGDGRATGIALDPTNDVYVAGMTSAAGFPATAGAFRTHAVGLDGFVTELNPAGNAMVYSTLLGGSSNDQIRAIAVNNSGIAFVTGLTDSSDFSVTSNAFQKALAPGATNAIVTAINAGGGSLYYSTYLGGSENTIGTTVTLDPAWNAYIGGYTSDSDFPVTSNAYQPGLKGTTDGFLSKVVIAADLTATMKDNVSSISRYGYVTFYGRVTNLGPDGADNVVFNDPIPSGWAYAGLYTITADSCTAPKVGSTSGTVVCKKKRLESGTTVYVNVYLQAIAASGSNIKNTISTSAQTQDLNATNNSVSLTVKVK